MREAGAEEEARHGCGGLITLSLRVVLCVANAWEGLMRGGLEREVWV